MHVPIGRAIDWVAFNDEPGAHLEDVKHQVTTLLIADLFQKKPEDIADRIIRRRKELNNARRN